MAKPFSQIQTKLGLDDKLTFGIYSGSYVDDILHERPDYIGWLIAKTTTQFKDEVIKEVVDKLLEKLDKQRNYKPTKVYSSKYGSAYGMGSTNHQHLHSDDLSSWLEDDVPF